MKELASTPEKKEVALTRGHPSITWTLLLGLIALSGGISSLQNLAQSFTDNPKYNSLIGNWTPWIAALVFVVGWVITHWIEIALLQRQITVARVLTISFLLGMVVISWALTNLVVHPVLYRLGGMFPQMLLSGYAFRLSMFSKESVSLLPRAFFGERQNN